MQAYGRQRLFNRPAIWKPLSLPGLARVHWFSFGLAAWFSLVFLGFSCPNLDFSMAYGRSAARQFFSLLSPKLTQHRSVAMTRLQPVSTDGRLDPGVSIGG